MTQPLATQQQVRVRNINLFSMLFHLLCTERHKAVMANYQRNIKEVSFSCAVRGYHYYRHFWHPTSGQNLNCEHEEGNVYVAIKNCTVTSRLTVGHLPIEVSRITKFLLDRGAKVYLQLSSNYFRRSPLTQGGLEIVCTDACYHSPFSSPSFLLDKYLGLVKDLYADPKMRKSCFIHT